MAKNLKQLFFTMEIWDFENMCIKLKIRWWITTALSYCIYIGFYLSGYTFFFENILKILEGLYSEFVNKFGISFQNSQLILKKLCFKIKRSKMYKIEIKDKGTKGFRFNFQWGLCDSLHSLKYWQGSASFYQPCSIKLQNSSCYCEFTDPTNLWITCEGAILRAIWYFVPNLKVFANLIQNVLNFLDCTVYWKGLL